MENGKRAINTPLNVYGKVMDARKREAHGNVVRLVLAAKVAWCLFEPMGFESADLSETKELCGAPWPSKVLKRPGGYP